MSIPNIQQQLYLKKALNEDTDGMFDHPTLDEGSYVHSKKQLKKAVKGSKREIVKAMKRGNKKDAEFWMQNKKDAESQMSESIAEGLLRRYNELTEGSRGLARHQRIVKALKKKTASLKSTPKPTTTADGEALHKRTMNTLKLSKGQQLRDRVQISRERMRAGLAPGIPSKTVSPPQGDETGTWRIKSGADRAPKTVLKYRAASAAKAAKGKAK